MRRLFLFAAVALASLITYSAAWNGDQAIRVTILYDNYTAAEGVETDWGFSCLVEGTEKTILFDAGANQETFARNADALNVDLTNVDVVVISHEHDDHTGGLPRLFAMNSNVPVYHPVSFSEDFTQSVRRAGAEAVPADKPVQICRDVYSTGEMGSRIKEQSMILKTAQGLVVITGCAHPGIVEILEKAREIAGGDIYMVFGGFHLREHPDDAVNEIIRRFRELGVKKCGATHCTGDRQIELFKRAYGQDFVKIGVGKVLPQNPSGESFRVLLRKGEIRARVKLIEFRDGVEISTMREAATTVSLSSFFHLGLTNPSGFSFGSENRSSFQGSAPIEYPRSSQKPASSSFKNSMPDTHLVPFHK